MVEAAFILPLLLLLFFGLVAGGMGVFRYQQVACMAQEASRWTSVRGSYYQNDTGNSSPTSAQILQSAVLPMLVGMDENQLTIKVELIDQGSNTIVNWDASSQCVTSMLKVRLSPTRFGSRSRTCGLRACLLLRSPSLA
jgi:Flp pilus assembly protein TadG